MSFCPKCNYLLDIHKSKIVDSKLQSIKHQQKLPLKSVAQGITQIIKNKKDSELFEAKFTKEQMFKNKNYSKLDIEDKNKMLNLFQQYGGNIGVMFLCTNCNWNKEINETIKLYNYNKDNKLKKILPDEYYLMVHNPIYSRTKNYECKNKDCPTHKNKNIKEAIFFKEDNSLIINYVCGTCYNTWTT